MRTHRRRALGAHRQRWAVARCRSGARGHGTAPVTDGQTGAAGGRQAVGGDSSARRGLAVTASGRYQNR